MGRMKVGIAAAGVLVVLIGVVAAATMRGDSGSNRAVTAIQTPGQSPVMAGPVPVAGPPAAQTAKTTPSTKPSAAATKAAQAKTAPLNSIPPTPSAQDIQKIIAAIAAPVAAPADSTATTAPLTKEQVEAQLREQLKLLGITY